MINILNCIESLPSIEESLNKICEYIEGVSIYFFLLGGIWILSMLLKFLYKLYYYDNNERNVKK